MKHLPVPVLCLLAAAWPSTALATCTCGVSPSGDASGATDTVAIQACLDGFGSSGGQVSLGAGTFYIQDSVELRSNVLIEGAGASSTTMEWVTDVTSKSYMFVWEGTSGTPLSDATIRNLRIDGQNYWIIGIKVDGGGGGGRGTRITVRDAEIVNCGEYGIHVKQSDGVYIRDVYLSHNGYNSYDDATPYAAGNIYALNHNIYLRGTTQAFIEDTESEDAAGDGINVSDSSSDVVISNTTANYNGQNGIRIADSDYARITGSTASYNGFSISSGSATCFVDDGLCNGIEFRTEDDGDASTYDGVTYGCVESTTANYNLSYWMYLQSSSSYELDSNSKSGNGHSDTKYESASSSHVSGVCSAVPRDESVWPFDRTGYGDAGASSSDCDGDGSAATADGGNDCDDGTAAVYVGAAETCDDGVDQDCTGADLSCADVDFDGDGYTTNTGDCDESTNGRNPSASETCDDGVDQDCTGTDLSCADVDFDGDGYTANEGDCDESTNGRNPAVPESCDGVDNDCDGLTDDASAVDAAVWYLDADGDGFGDGSAPDYGCDAPAGHVSDSTDCDDTNPSASPTSGEITGDGVDEDCDGVEICYVDGDEDGYRLDATVVGATVACDSLGEASGSANLDCDDADATIHPGAAEADCTDPVDYNCDGSVTWADADADGFAACEDCDDATAAIHPGAVEIPGDAADGDCDGVEICYEDEDGDAYRSERTVTGATIACAGAGEALASAELDCDDETASVHPGAEEADCADPVDYNCDGSVAFADADGDGFAACEECDDTDPTANPGAPETCNGTDDDCDGDVDGDAIDAPTWYADADADGYTDANVNTSACMAPEGYAAATELSDCDDGDARRFPGGTDTPGDGIDQDCDGRDAAVEDTGALVDTGEEAADGGKPGSRGCQCGNSDPRGLSGLAAVFGLLIMRRRRAPMTGAASDGP